MRGGNRIVSVIESSMNQAVTNGLLAPGIWNGNSFGTLKTGDTLTSGYYVYVFPQSSQSQNERESRHVLGHPVCRQTVWSHPFCGYRHQRQPVRRNHAKWNIQFFIDVTASITGPGGSFDPGYGSANAKDGITITRTQDRNNMIVGADGSAMHSRRADRSGRVTVRLLKTSNRNAMLRNMFNAQSIDASLWGQNLISISHKTFKDEAVCSFCAFLRDPDMAYVEDVDIVE